MVTVNSVRQNQNLQTKHFKVKSRSHMIFGWIRHSVCLVKVGITFDIGEANMYCNLNMYYRNMSDCMTTCQLALKNECHLLLRYSKTCLKQPLKDRQNKGLKDKW